MLNKICIIQRSKGFNLSMVFVVSPYVFFMIPFLVLLYVIKVYFSVKSTLELIMKFTVQSIFLTLRCLNNLGSKKGLEFFPVHVECCSGSQKTRS